MICTNETKPLAKLIHKARHHKRAEDQRPFSMIDVSQACGVHRTHIYKLLNGEVYPEAWTLARLSNGLGSMTDRSPASIRKMLHVIWPQPD